jgi:hypothetical protein
MSSAQNRRRAPRMPRASLAGLRVHFESQKGLQRVMPARLLDLNEQGCGVEVRIALMVGMPVVVTGDLTNQGGGQEMRLRARVAWCEATSQATWRAGLEFETLLPSDWEKGHTRVEAKVVDTDDYYEVLQLSSSADQDTIQRVYRILAARYHPDNQETGNSEMFRRISEAHRVLTDPEKRAAFDADYLTQKRLRWKIFDKPEAAQGLNAERAKRYGILSLLYTKRAATPAQPTLSIIELEDLLGVPREHLEFSLWFLRESGFVVRTDNARFSITVQGVLEAESRDNLLRSERREDHLLRAPGTVMA